MSNFDVLKFQNISINEGLSQNTVYSIIQDKKGFMWFCTQQGLNKYDGYKIITFKNNPEDSKSLSNNFVHTIFRDADDNLWVGSLQGEISRYDSTNDCFDNFFVPGENNSGKNRILINDFADKSKDEIFIATNEDSIKIFNKRTSVFSPFINEQTGSKILFNESYCVLLDNAGYFWIGTWSEGLYRYDFKNKILSKYNFEIGNSKSLSNDRVRFIFQDSRGLLWIGTSNGINNYDYANNNFIRYKSDSTNSFEVTSNTMTCIAEDKKGVLWIGTKSSGLLKFKPNENIFTEIKAEPDIPGSLGSNTIFSLYSDRSNVLWIGTFNSGIYKLDCEAKKFYGIGNLIDNARDESNLDVTAIVKDDSGDIWLGTAFQGTFKIDVADKKLIWMQDKYEITKAQKNQTVMCLYKDDNNIIWAGSLFHGLNKFDTEKNKVENYSSANSDGVNTINSISNYFEDDKYLWIGAEKSGLLRFDKSKGEYISLSELKLLSNNVSNNDIKYIYTTSDGVVWIGTIAGGLNKLDFKKGHVTYYLNDPANPESVNQNNIITLCEDKTGNLWIGTFDKGLSKFDRNKDSFSNFDTNDGLSDNAVRALVSDSEGNLWISTNNGLSKFNQKTGKFKNYFDSDGLQSREFNLNSFYKSDDGIIYFGGVNGFNFFNPDDITDNPFIPVTVITDFQIFNKSVKNSPENPFLKQHICEADEIMLSYRESVFSFEFASLIYNNQERNQYAYKMEGFDKDWIYCGSRRFVTYTNLEPGIYYFRVKSSNNDGVWDKQGTKVKIVITPPFWKTLWFKSLSLLSIIGATGLAYQQKLSKIEKEKKSQEEFSRKLLESQEQERKKIASELHDTIAHDVLITKNKISMGLKNVDDTGKIKEVLDEISELASNTLNDVRSISYNLHPHQLERLGLTKAIKSIINNVSKSTDINFIVSLDNIDKILSKELEINVFRIIQECFNNIIKHSEATESELIVKKRDNILEIIISDNGKGFPKNVRYGMGMTNIEERVKLYNGQLKIETHEGKGTNMNILIPVDKY